MRHLKLLAIALSAIMALTAIIATTAQAAPELKAASYPVEVNAEGGAGELTQGANAIKCEHFTAAGNLTSTTLGLVVIKWTGCTDEGVKCKSEEAGNGLKPTSNGEIWVETPVHITLLTSGPNMTSLQLYYFLFLFESVSLKCGVLAIKVIGDHGGVLILTGFEEGVAVKAKTAVALEGKGSGGVQEVTSCEEPAELCGESPIELLSEFVAGEPKSAVLTQTGEMKFGAEVTAEG